jgi:cobalt-zinc-cadmium efflux system protein
MVIAVLETVAGLSGRSMALLADAGHNTADIAAAVLAFAAVRLARRPPTAAKSFGYHRSGVLAAEVNAGAVLVVSVLVAVGAIARLAQPVNARASLMVVVAAIALFLNGAGAVIVTEGRGDHELNVKAVSLHLAADAAASAGVVVAGTVLLIDRHLSWVDPAVSLLIAALVAGQAVRLGRRVADVLLEGTPPSTDTAALAIAVVGTPGVEDVHDLHVWSLSSEVTLLSAHLVMSGHPSLEGAQEVAGTVRARLAHEFGIAHATLELECEACTDGPRGQSTGHPGVLDN